jgi:EAL and modified HD-GYP domain-containing signal transduction protein
MDDIRNPALSANQIMAGPQEPLGEIRYLARHPLLKLNGRVHGYELLFRHGHELAFRGDSNQATRTILDNTVLFGIDRFTGGLPAFVNCSIESITEQLVDVLPPAMTVIELGQTSAPSHELLAACRRLKSIGYHIALDGFSWRPESVPLVELADYIKVDFLKSNSTVRKDLFHRLRGYQVTLIATKVETQEDFRQAAREGFSLFQGFYFCLPELLSNAKVPANRLIHFQILQHLYRDPIDLPQVSKLVMRDASLTYRLLRLVNSPAYAIRQEISSIELAIMVVGEDLFRRIATLAILSELNAGHPPEILHMAFVRARFCELAAPLAGLSASEQYLLGMISLLPAMLRLPMESVVSQLPLRHEIRQALLGTVNPERRLLSWLEFHERGIWASCDAIVQAHGFDQQELLRYYTDAVTWDSATDTAKL